MTVLELKNILKQYPDNMEVFVDLIEDDHLEHDNLWVSTVREPNVNSNLMRIRENKVAQRPCKATKDAKQCLVL